MVPHFPLRPRSEHIFCLNAEFMNDPAQNTEDAIATDVIARLTFKDDAGNTLFEMLGRWGDTLQPPNLTGQTVAEIRAVDFPIWQIRELNIAFKYTQERFAYGFNNESYGYIDWKNPHRELRDVNYTVVIELGAARVDQKWVLQFRNLGVGLAFEAVSHSEQP